MNFTKHEIKIITAINRKYLLEHKIKQFTDELDTLNNYIDNSKHIIPLGTANKKLIRNYKNILNKETDDEEDEETTQNMDHEILTDAGS
jgi:hypothetical protein